jgi:O-antigen ligase
LVIRRFVASFSNHFQDVTALSERLVIAALAWGALAWGSVYPWGYWPLAALSAGIGIHAIVVNRAWHDPRVRHLGLALIAVVAAVTVQLVALPYETVQRLSPGVDRFFREYVVGFVPPPLQTLSIAPISTLVSLSLIVAFALLFCGLVSALRRMSLEWLINHVLGFGVALAVLGLIEKAFSINVGIPRSAGFWDEDVANSFGPFYNRNHFAGWMVMALPLITGYSCAVLAKTYRSREPGALAGVRWLMTVEASRFLVVAFSALLMGVALVVTGSRSGIASFAGATCVFGFVALRRSRSRRTTLVTLGYLGVILLGALLWAGTDATIGRFMAAQTDAQGRISGWKDNARMVSDFRWFGIGIGAYPRAMLVYQSEDRQGIHGHAHNEYLQLAAEGGVLVGVPAAVTLWLLIAGIRRRIVLDVDDTTTMWIRAGAVAGLAGIAAQSMLEFSLQVPANKVLFIFLLAIALHRARGDTLRTPRRAERHTASHDAYRV